jgi:hypothetical protein
VGHDDHGLPLCLNLVYDRKTMRLKESAAISSIATLLIIIIIPSASTETVKETVIGSHPDLTTPNVRLY